MEQSEFTYDEQRVCLNSPTPIPDQAHGLRKFCPPSVLSDGSIKNCKDEFHSKRKKLLKEIADKVQAIKDVSSLVNKRNIGISSITLLTEDGRELGIKFYQAINFLEKKAIVILLPDL